MKNGTLPTSLHAPLYKLLEQPTTKLRCPFSWKRALRFTVISVTALTGILAAPLSRAFFLLNCQANARAEHQQAMTQLADDVAKGWRPMPTKMTEIEYQKRMAAHELTLGDVNRHNRGE